MVLKNDYKYIAVETVFPFFGIIYSIKNKAVKSFPLIFALFFFFFGTQIIITDSNDIGRYLQVFSDLSNYDNISFWGYFYSMNEGNQIDYYLPFMTWLISRFTSNSQLFAGILAMLMGLCYGFNFSYIVKRLENTNLLSLVLLFLLFLIPRSFLCTHRWWMALQVFLLGALPYVLDGKNKYVLFSILSIFIHFSFLYPLVLLLVYRFLPRRSLLLFVVLFFLTNFIDSLNINTIAKMFEQYLPDAYAARNESYINAEFLEHNWFSQSYKLIWKYVNILLVLYIYLNRKALLGDDSRLRDLFVISLLIGSFVAISAMTEWGGRYYDLSNFLFCCLYVLILSKQPNVGGSFNKVITILSPFLVFNILFQIRGIFAVIGVKTLLFGNVFTTWIIEESTSILELLKG